MQIFAMSLSVTSRLVRKKCSQFIVLPMLLLFTGIVHAMSFPAVQNLQITSDQLQWDEVADAGGYNVYYYAGGPSKFEITFDYLATVKNATSFAGLQPGLYRVVAFNRDATVYGDLGAARTIWLKEGGSVGNANVGSGDGTTVIFSGSNNDRYIVETECNDASTGICVASCNTAGNQGVVTGGYCSASKPHINGSGGADNYSCYSPTLASVITAGAYCVK